MKVSRNELINHVVDGHHRLKVLKQQYTEQFGIPPRVVASAPGRTEIIGNHTDHNNGLVVAAGIQEDTLVVAGPAPRDQKETFQLLSQGWDRHFSVARAETNKPANPPPELHDTERLMQGVAAGLAERGLPAPGYRACMDSTVLPGSGLSSSAALEIALAGIHGALADFETPPLAAALAGQHAENHFMGKPSGLMDQLASALGGMHAIDFADPEAPRTHRIEVDFSQSNHRLMVVNTGGSHANLTDQYAAIPREMHSVAAVLGARTLANTTRKQLLAKLSTVRKQLGDRAVLRAFHFFDEQDRVSAFVDAADSRLNDRLLEIMTESGGSSISLLQNVYPPGSEQDQGLALGLSLTATYLRQRGGTGAYRVHGGGFAGTMLAVVPEELFLEYQTAMNRVFGPGAVIPLEIRPQGLIAADL